MKVFNNLIETFKAFGRFRESISVFSSSLNLDTAKIIASKAKQHHQFCYLNFLLIYQFPQVL